MLKSNQVPLYTEVDFACMRRAGQLAAECLDEVGAHVQPGITTGALDQICESFIRDHNAIPAPLGYRGYPKATCISLNHVVCHGIPGTRRLREGDILNIDVTVNLDGWFGDSSRMHAAGTIRPEARRLIDVVYTALDRGVAEVGPGKHLGDIGAAIQSYVRQQNCSVVRDYCGHGIGRVFHDAPSVLHYGVEGTGIELQPGMIFTIEPMVNLGRHETRMLGDGWTAVTRDRSLSAQVEHTVGVTPTGVEVFTLSSAGRFHPFERTEPHPRTDNDDDGNPAA